MQSSIPIWVAQKSLQLSAVIYDYPLLEGLYYPVPAG